MYSIIGEKEAHFGDGLHLVGGEASELLYPAPGYLSYVRPKYVVQSLEELERRVDQLPPGTKLHWDRRRSLPNVDAIDRGFLEEL